MDEESRARAADRVRVLCRHVSDARGREGPFALRLHRTHEVGLGEGREAFHGLINLIDSVLFTGCPRHETGRSPVGVTRRAGPRPGPDFGHQQVAERNLVGHASGTGRCQGQ